MSDAVNTFRVSSAYIRNLRQQALFGCIGSSLSWILFLAISLWLLPVSADAIWKLMWRAMNVADWLQPNWSSEDHRELVRFGLGPIFFVTGMLAAIGDVSSWLFVRYEIHPDSLRMSWRRISRQVMWDLIQSVDERPHASPHLCSLKIVQNGVKPILVRGLECMPEFKELLKSRLPRLTKWTVWPVRIDLTRPLTNLMFGFLLILPVSVSWIAYYVVGLHSLELFWAVLLLPIAFWFWFLQPLSRAQQCVREVEMTLVVVMMILSGALTCVSWTESPIPLPGFLFSWLGW